MPKRLCLQVLLLSAMSLLVVSCASAPQVITGATGGTVQIHRIEPKTTSFLGISYTREAGTRFWIFAEDGVPYTVGPGTVREQPHDNTVVAWGPGLESIGQLNGLLVTVHREQLLIGKHDFGAVQEGDTVELTKRGVFVAGQFRGQLPES